MPTSTTATKVKPTASRGSAKPSNGSTGSAVKADRVTADDAVIIGTVGKVNRSQVPREALTKGERKNPYDVVMEASFKENDEESDDWRQVTTKNDDKIVENQIKLIRNAAHYLEVGSRILKPQKNTDEDGNVTVTIWFRAQELRKKGPRTKEEKNTTASE